MPGHGLSVDLGGTAHRAWHASCSGWDSDWPLRTSVGSGGVEAAAIALVVQIVLLPALCFGLVLAFDLPPELAVGMMLLADVTGWHHGQPLQSPVRGARGVERHPHRDQFDSGRADPSAGGQLLRRVLSARRRQHRPRAFDKVLRVFAIVLVPVAIGMLVRAAGRAWRTRSTARCGSSHWSSDVAVIARAVLGERETSPTTSSRSGLAVLVFNVLSLLIGYGVPRLAGSKKKYQRGRVRDRHSQQHARHHDRAQVRRCSATRGWWFGASTASSCSSPAAAFGFPGDEEDQGEAAAWPLLPRGRGRAINLGRDEPDGRTRTGSAAGRRRNGQVVGRPVVGPAVVSPVSRGGQPCSRR